MPKLRSGKRELSRDQRVDANRQIAQAMNFMRALKGLYWMFAVVTGLVLLFATLGKADVLSILIPLGVGVAMAVAGALEVERNPVPWSIAIALTWTTLYAIVAVPVIRAGEWTSPGFRGLLVAACWTAVGIARRAVRIAKAHPELRLARRMRGRTIQDELGDVSTKYQDRARAEHSTRVRRRLAFVGAVVALLAGVIFIAARSTKSGAESGVAALPPPAYAPDFFVAKFRGAWNANRLDDVKAMFVPESRAKFSRGIDWIIKNHGWTPLPELAAPRVTNDSRYAAAYFAMTAEAGELYTSWAYDEPTKTWMINALRPPKD